MGPRRWYLGSSFVLADWQVRAFGTSGILDITSDHMYIRTITMFGCMGRRYRYTPFYYQACLSIW